MLVLVCCWIFFILSKSSSTRLWEESTKAGYTSTPETQHLYFLYGAVMNALYLFIFISLLFSEFSKREALSSTVIIQNRQLEPHLRESEMET